MSYGTRTQFTVVANMISKGELRSALDAYLNTFNRYGLADNPDRAEIIGNLTYLFEAVSAQDPLHVVEKAVEIRGVCPKAQVLQDQAMKLFLRNALHDLGNLSEQQFTTGTKDRIGKYSELAGKLVAGSESEDERETCFGIYRQAILIIATDGLSDALFWAGIAANNRFSNPSDEQRFSDIYTGLVHESAKREGSKQAAWNACFAGDDALHSGIFQTAVTKVAIHYLEATLEDESTPKADIINRLGYHFTRSPSNPLLAAKIQDFYLRNVHLAAEEALLDTYVAAEEIRNKLKNVNPSVIAQFDQLLSTMERKISFVSSHRGLGRTLRESMPTNAAG